MISGTEVDQFRLEPGIYSSGNVLFLGSCDLRSHASVTVTCSGRYHPSKQTG